jgi:hypothetical protein
MGVALTCQGAPAGPQPSPYPSAHSRCALDLLTRLTVLREPPRLIQRFTPDDDPGTGRIIEPASTPATSDEPSRPIVTPLPTLDQESDNKPHGKITLRAG